MALIWSTLVGVISIIIFTNFVFEVKGLFVRSNCSILSVRVLIRSSLFESLRVLFPTSAGLKIGRFLSRLLSRK